MPGIGDGEVSGLKCQAPDHREQMTDYQIRKSECGSRKEIWKVYKDTVNEFKGDFNNG